MIDLYQELINIFKFILYNADSVVVLLYICVGNSSKMTIKHLSIMKEVTFTFSDYSPVDGECGIFGFVIFQVYYHEDSYGFFATRNSAEKYVISLKKHLDYDYQISPINVSF